MGKVFGEGGVGVTFCRCFRRKEGAFGWVRLVGGRTVCGEWG